MDTDYAILDLEQNRTTYRLVGYQVAFGVVGYLVVFVDLAHNLYRIVVVGCR